MVRSTNNIKVKTIAMFSQEMSRKAAAVRVCKL